MLESKFFFFCSICKIRFKGIVEDGEVIFYRDSSRANFLPLLIKTNSGNKNERFQKDKLSVLEFRKNGSSILIRCSIFACSILFPPMVHCPRPREKLFFEQQQ